MLGRIFPFGCAIAERLWSPESQRNASEAAPRLDAHRCRMVARGLGAEPANGPGYCPQEFVSTYVPPWSAS